MAKVRPTRSVSIDKLVGKNVLVYINFGESATEASPVWCLIGGQRNGNLTMSADDIDASNKSSGGWGETYPGIKSTELSLEGIINCGDEGYAALKDAFIKGEAVDICRYASDGTADRNWYNITELSDETPHDDMATFSATLGGVGKPKFYSNLTSINDVTGLISSNSQSRVTISKAAAADVVVTIESGTITGLKLGGSDVSSSNYSIAAGGKSIVILGTYLDDLTAGEAVFEVQVTGGRGNFEYTVTITA